LSFNQYGNAIISEFFFFAQERTVAWRERNISDVGRYSRPKEKSRRDNKYILQRQIFGVNI
jgi:hypothetical protein